MPQSPGTYQIQPRVAIDLLPDGSYRLEYSIGPYRHQEIIENVPWQVKDALRAQVIANENARALAQARKEQYEAETKRRVWRTTAGNHGIEFANRVVNGVKSSKINARVQREADKGRKASRSRS